MQRHAPLLVFAALTLLPPPAAAQGILGRVKQAAKSAVKVDTGRSGSTSPGAAQAGEARRVARPAVSSAHPEVAGIKMGVSTLADVQAAWSKATPVMKVGKPTQVRLVGKTERGEDVDVPSANYVGQLQAMTASHLKQGYDPEIGFSRCSSSVPKKGQERCEEIAVYFAPYPSPAVALATHRVVYLTQPVLFDVMEKALTDAYGTISAREDAQFGNTWTWLQTAEGKSISDAVYRNCLSASGSVNDWDVLAYATTFSNFRNITKRATAASDCGVASMVRVHMWKSNGVVDHVDYVAMDVHGYMNANERAVAVQDSAVAEFLRKQREDAAKVKPPE